MAAPGRKWKGRSWQQIAQVAPCGQRTKMPAMGSLLLDGGFWWHQNEWIVVGSWVPRSVDRLVPSFVGDGNVGLLSICFKERFSLARRKWKTYHGHHR
jgi:hypothetical protein